MYEHIKISDSCPKDMLNYNFYYGIPIITPRDSVSFRVRNEVETFVRSKCTPGIYRDPEYINSIIKDIFSFLEKKITPLVKELSCVDLIILLLDEYSKSCAVQEFYSRGQFSPNREQWGDRNGFRRSVKYLAEKMLEYFEESKQVSENVQPTDFEYLIELTEIAFDFSIQSATTYGISRERTIYELYGECPNPYKQYYDVRIVGYNHEDFENAHLLFRHFVGKNGSLHQNIIEEYKSSIKGCSDKSCQYLRDFFEIFHVLMHLDHDCNDVFIPKNEFKTKLATKYNIPIDSIDLFIEIYSINKEGLKKNPRFIYGTKQEYRLKKRFIMEFESKGIPYLLYTLEMLNESYRMLHKALCYNDLPVQLNSEKLKNISANITRSYGKKFEAYANDFLKTKGFVGSTSKRKLPSGIIIPGDVGEIDFLGYSKEQKKLVCFEFKNVFYSTDPLEHRDDLEKFVRKKDSYLNKFKKKIDFVKTHIGDLTSYYRQTDSVDLSEGQLITSILTYAPNISRFFMTDCKCMSLAEFEVEWAKNPEQFFVDTRISRYLST